MSEFNITALISPTINFLLFFAILFFKGKKLIVNIFAGRTKRIQDFYDHTDAKYKEACIRLKNMQEKIKNIESDKKRIHREAEKELVTFSEEYKNEVVKKIKKMENDAWDTLEAEKRAVFSNMKEELLEMMVLRVRENVKSNSEYRQKIAHKMLRLFK